MGRAYTHKKTGSGTATGRTARRCSVGLATQVRLALDQYFRNLNGHEPPGGLYDLVLAEVEPPLIEMVMHRCNNNITYAARMLGINRTTLSKRLKKYGLAD